MKLHKALKVKNRLAGEVNRLQDILRRENSRRSDNPSVVDRGETFNELLKVYEKLSKLKGAISEATAPVSTKLAQIQENKSLINFLNGLPTREGQEVTFVGRDQEKLIYTWTAQLNRADIDNKVVELQKRINDHQDDIDLFNSSTTVNFDE